MPREINDIVEGYNEKMKRENEKLLFHAKVARKAAYISILPHIKNLSEDIFNSNVWPIDEKKALDEEESEEIITAGDHTPLKKIEGKADRLKKMQDLLKNHNLKLSDARRKKVIKK